MYEENGGVREFTIITWLAVAVDALFIAIDLISQLILVSLLKYDLVSTYVFFFLLNEVLPMLDHVAQTIGSGCPGHFITCVYRC